MKCTRPLVVSRVPLNMDVTCIITHYNCFRQIQRHVKKLFFLYQVCRWGTLFVVVELHQRYHKNILWLMTFFNSFLLMYEFPFCTTHGVNVTCRFDTEVFVPDAIFCGVICSPYWFIKVLIGKTGNILWVIYINTKCVSSSKTCECTIIEFVMVRNFRHIP